MQLKNRCLNASAILACAVTGRQEETLPHTTHGWQHLVGSIIFGSLDNNTPVTGVWGGERILQRNLGCVRDRPLPEQNWASVAEWPRAHGWALAKSWCGEVWWTVGTASLRLIKWNICLYFREKYGQLSWSSFEQKGMGALTFVT